MTVSTNRSRSCSGSGSRWRTRVDVAASAALGQQAPAGFEVALKGSEQRVVVGDPVQRGVGEDHVHRLGQRQLRQVLADGHSAIADRLLGVGDHRWRRVDGVHRAVRNAPRQLQGDLAAAAAGIEHHLVAVELQAVELLGRPALLGSRDPVIGGGVPVARAHRLNPAITANRQDF